MTVYSHRKIHMLRLDLVRALNKRKLHDNSEIMFLTSTDNIL